MRFARALFLLAFVASPHAQAADKAEKPDITSRKGLKIGSVSIPWDGSGELKGTEAIHAGAQDCAFHATYDMSNVGGAATSPAFTNRLRIDGARVVATNSGLALGPYETKSITTAPSLPVGRHTLELSLDDDGSVAESNEANNRFKVVYELKAPCGAPAVPGKTPAPAGK